VNNIDGLLRSTPIAGRSDILTGGSFGPDASVFACVIGMIAVATILHARKKGWFRLYQDRLGMFFEDKSDGGTAKISRESQIGKVRQD
jgi:hypothetical protein